MVVRQHTSKVCSAEDADVLDSTLLMERHMMVVAPGMQTPPV